VFHAVEKQWSWLNGGQPPGKARRLAVAERKGRGPFHRCDWLSRMVHQQRGRDACESMFRSSRQIIDATIHGQSEYISTFMTSAVPWCYF